MERTVFVTGGDRGLGFALCAGLLEAGWRVFAGQCLPRLA
jgi:NAD(P)-dependent dehydrogenase (short-subunit alcohol dehydrogenase family)